METPAMQFVAAAEVKDDYLESTDHISYQYSNLIQPHILFFNVDPQSQVILNVSTNVSEWIGVSSEEVVGRVLSDEFFAGISDLLREMGQLETKSAQVFSNRIKDRKDNRLMCRIAPTSTRWMIELELEHHAFDSKIDTDQLEQLLLSSIGALDSDASVQDLVENTTRNLREVLGFERGMCYQFDGENNGEVIAESTAVPEDIKYLRLRFPSRDIPRTAREMLLATPIRTTLDQRLDCHEIFPCFEPNSQQYVDLTYVRGRGAAGSCREYYLNLNIRSTLVLPLVVENRLWGLLSFHDHEVRRVSPRFDEHLQSIAKCLSVSLERKLRSLREQARKRGSQVVKELSVVDTISDQWLKHVQTRANDLKDLILCDGFILRLSGEILTAGNVPELSERRYFTDTLWKLTQGKALNTNCLNHLCEGLGKYNEVAAGVIAIPLSANFNDIAIWMRPEQKQNVHWAGDPLGNIDSDSTGSKRLSVRESFDVWTRESEYKCLAWTEQEVCLATSAAMQIGLLSLSWHAAQANQAKTQFLSCMSHEIRTPMTAILGYANLLKEQHQSTIQNNQTSDFIEVIERNGLHLLSIIDDILNLAKIEAGKLTVEQIPVSLPDLVTDVVDLIKVQAEAKNLDFRVELGTPIPKIISGDAVRIRQILLNLLGNAFKFTNKGNVTLRVSYDKITKQIHFDVIDSGIGLTELQISRLFSAFSQADSSTTRRFGGSGLGLNISKNLAQLLGGDITVQSELGVGSSFRATVASGCEETVELVEQIGRYDTVGHNRELNTSAQDRKSTLPPNLQTLRIMLLEDGEDNQRLLRHILSKAGAEVTVFSNGREGIESVTIDGLLESPLLDPFPFDMILTDMQMPEMDGYSTTQLLRQKRCNKPIIALTAFAMEGNDGDCIRAGCDDYLSKPVKRESLLEMCEKWMPKRGQKRDELIQVENTLLHS